MSQTWCRTRTFLRQFHSGRNLFKVINRQNMQRLREMQASSNETPAMENDTRNRQKRHYNERDMVAEQTSSNKHPSMESGSSNVKEQKYQNRHHKKRILAKQTSSNDKPTLEDSSSNTVEQTDIQLLERLEAESRVPLFTKYLSKSGKFSEMLRDVEVDVSEIPEIPESLKSVEDLQKSLKELEQDIQKLRAAKEELMSRPQGFIPAQEKKPVFWGTADPKWPASDVPCGGCGAMLHCQDTAIPGYVPQQKFKDLSVEDLETTLCQRCHRLNQNEVIVDVEADAALYQSIVKRIRMEKALILMVVDVTDISNSLIHDYIDQVGRMSSVIILGNKVDLIPKDSDGYLTRLKDKIWEECMRANLNPRGNNIKDVRLISAKTGYGMEELITKLVSYWELKGNVYLVGTTNSGKSTLFNKFLESDYCKFTCRDILQRATVSKWPGTTLNLIKFPIVKMRPQMAYYRQIRLEVDAKQAKHEKENRKDSLLKYGGSKNAALIGHVGKTEFRSEQAVQQDQETFIPTGQQFTAYNPNLGPDLETENIEHSNIVHKKDILQQRRVVSHAEFPDSVWTYDTPGLINEDQLINFLTPEELKLVLTRLMIRPRVFVMQPGDTMFITGLARVDYLDGRPNTPFAVFTGHMLPVHIVKQSEADDFYTETVGTPTLGVPLGDSGRLAKLPSLVSRDFSLKTFNEDHFMLSADLQLSSLGWLSIGGKNIDVALRVYTPGGRGLHLRQPALLPNLRAFMGDRQRGTKSYKIRKLRP